ncbi:dihydroneopterin aldolase [Breoghania sp. L-A4]|uniref:dihydroneopterin aldolase n=1 Tax=Breoghania sp. L-A4 TaxID=2304600 RepID=UPI000E35FAAD|nr:dihydroneopterin aldolase [Breoghania sp. L-A4]AXS40853.1 dihydroneopterin aldolase [Breoghania sp. L-A4]
MERIILEDLAFYAFHGVHDEEARLGQRFHVDMTVHADLSKAVASDHYADTICYASLVKTIEEVVTGGRFNLIERLAGAIADAVLAVDPRIDTVDIRVHKPGAPLPLSTGHVSIALTKSRG